MKKIYMTPEADVILISSSDILMLSYIDGATDGLNASFNGNGWKFDPPGISFDTVD